ncbi:hypothetical protein GLS40_04215 [Pseudooceanicola sp. 216_PA32_1]|uniref:Uncharacterized protein n=1 Tax=Pseudooceanicola pacificus TaxID=2676438 RepID=A0A844WCG2_9RHOB|nr:hypothetical protein [Pseudooceanicola pacificus]MWB77220.1 hypothetical protein [Pseudooceanicola pacificus]
MFADGAGGFHLMGNWDNPPLRERPSSGQGLPDNPLAIADVPAVLARTSGRGVGSVRRLVMSHRTASCPG